MKLGLFSINMGPCAAPNALAAVTCSYDSGTHAVNADISSAGAATFLRNGNAIWLNGVASSASTEVMIWTDNYNQVPSGSSVETVTFDGASYKVYKSGSYIAFVSNTNVTSGTLNLLSFFNHVISKGWITATSTVGAIDYGVELVSTNGMNATFSVTNFSLTTQ